MPTINEIWSAYDEEKGSWTGCGWPARFGSLGLELNGFSPDQALKVSAHWEEVARGGPTSEDTTITEEAALVGAAQHSGLTASAVYPGSSRDPSLRVCGRSARRFCARALATEWRYGAEWLQQVEADAAWAEEEAGQAVAAVERGDWSHALGLASRASSIASQYAGHHPWRHLERLIGEAVA